MLMRRASYVVSNTLSLQPSARSINASREGRDVWGGDLPVSWRTITRNGGCQVRSSLCHCLSVVTGATIREGLNILLWCRPARKAATCTVFPRPISSPMMPASDFVSADTSVRSPRKSITLLSILILIESKYPENSVFIFENRVSDACAAASFYSVVSCKREHRLECLLLKPAMLASTNVLSA